MIAESHISIHTFPRRGFLTADIYSCKSGVNAQFFADYLKARFELVELEVQIVQRGTMYPEQNL